MRQPPSLAIVVATGVIQSLRDYLPLLEGQINRFAASATELVVEDRSPVDELTYRLVRDIPAGSVWLGITRLDNAGAWQSSEPAISRFVAETRRRLTNDEIFVWRLFHFATDDAFGGMRQVLEDEASRGVNVGFQIRGEPPPDISLVWTPTGDGEVSSREARPLDFDRLLSGADVPCLTRLCAIHFSTAAGILLTRAVVYAGESEMFQSLLLQFAKSWSSADKFWASSRS